MVPITLPTQDVCERSDVLHELFTPLRGKRPRVAIGLAKDSPKGTTALVATDRKSGALRYREESFATWTQVLRCSYFELWKGSAGDDWTLDRAYFTLIEVVPAIRTFRELLCIHADPHDDNDLKQGPHLHVTCAPDPLRHCHFPLEFGFLEAVLKDCDSLTTAMQRAINVVARDVLPRFKDR